MIIGCSAWADTERPVVDDLREYERWLSRRCSGIRRRAGSVTRARITTWTTGPLTSTRYSSPSRRFEKAVAIRRTSSWLPASTRSATRTWWRRCDRRSRSNQTWYTFGRPGRTTSDGLRARIWMVLRLDTMTLANSTFGGTQQPSTHALTSCWPKHDGSSSAESSIEDSGDRHFVTSQKGRSAVRLRGRRPRLRVAKCVPLSGVVVMESPPGCSVGRLLHSGHVHRAGATEDVGQPTCVSAHRYCSVRVCGAG